MTQAVSALAEEKAPSRRKRRRIPRALIYEMRHGRPIYYRDYEKVLAGELPLEAVMGSSAIQWKIIMVILQFLLQALDLRQYEVATNEVGFRIAPRSWRSLDIAIFDKEAVRPYWREDKWVDVPPLVAIEVDTKASLQHYGDFFSYVLEKTQDLLDAGVKRVIWVSTKDRKVLVAEPEKRWYITSWDDPVEVWNGVEMNLQLLLEQAGVVLEEETG